MNRFLLFCMLFLASLSLVGQSSLQNAIQTFVKDPQFAPAGISISVVEKNTGNLVASHNPHLSLIPASTLKVITTAMALEVLGEDFQFVTSLEHDGSIDAQGVLRGNLYIKGKGDPTLGSHHFEKAEKLEVVLAKWAQAIEAHGIKRIEGKIIGDASYFNGAACVASWPWEDLGNYYGSGAWGLNLQENLYFLHLQQKSKLGAMPDILKTEPEIPNLLLLNEMKSAEKGSGDQAYIFGGPYSYTRFVRGTIPVGTGVFKVKGSIPDPPFFAAYELMRSLDKKGIDCTAGASSLLEEERTGNQNLERSAPGSSLERKSFYNYSSPRLKDIVAEANRKSVNIYCEAMLKAIGQQEKSLGTTEAGIAVIEERLKAKGLSLDGFFMQDGSGLSPRNGITSAQLSNFLYQIRKNKTIGSLFYRSLAVGGKSGTLRYLFKGTVAEGKIHGKSGGMGRVRSYAGYATTVGGKELIFSIIANNYTGKSGDVRRKMERLMIDFCKN